MKQDLFVFAFLVLACMDSGLRGSFGIGSLAVLAIFLIAVFFRELRHRNRADFVTQLKSYRRELRAGGTVVVDNMMLRYDTPITTYHLNVGIIFTSITIPSPYRIAKGEGHAESLLYSTLSLVSGWWALPMGPILTLHHIRENLTGGEHMPIAMLIDGKLLMRAVEEQTVRQFHRKLKGEPVNEEKQEVFTGDTSHSNRMLGKRTRMAKAISAEERFQEFDNPTPPGVRAVEQMQELLDNFKDDFRAKIRKSIRVPKGKRSQKYQETE